MLKNINFPAVSVLIIYPVILIALFFLYFHFYHVGIFEISFFVLGYYISNIAVGIGLHRLWSHDSYKTNKIIEFILVMLSAGTLQGPALSWASNHFKHHSYTDTEQDPHTPLKYRSKFMGFFWSHIGWMLVGEGSYKSIDKITLVKLGRNKLLRWQLKYYWQLASFMNLALPLLVGYIIGGNIQYALAGFLFIGLGRALQQEITFFVNSLCHFIGKQPYTKGTSGDIWWLAILLLGENWHNFHHAFPSDYRNGIKWHHFDVHKWIIYLMSKCGLAWDLKITDSVRVNAKITQTMEQFTKMNREKLENMQIKVNELCNICQQRFLELENSSISTKKKLWKILYKSQDKLNYIKTQIQEYTKSLETSSGNITIAINKKVQKFEQSLYKIYNEINLILS